MEVEEGRARERGRLANFQRSRQRSLLPIPAWQLTPTLWPKTPHRTPLRLKPGTPPP